MNEQEQVSQLSALFDGELPRDQAEMVIRRVLKDPSLRATWSRYALIGACVRSEPLAVALPRVDLASRVRSRLAAEPEMAMAGKARAAVMPAAAGRASLLRRGALGGAIAASVALVSLVLVRYTEPAPGVAGSGAPVQMAQQAAPEAQSPAAPAPVLVARESAPRSYTTPVDDSPARKTPLFNYVAAHSDVAVSAVRLAPLSSVMGGGFDPTQDAVEMSAAEVGARR
ncbi:MAG TPA: sigma-E factor negative regulatory protein [Steroidobacteraceae bacterium]|nr:sigma-E factor negative regulatory protein [Steroidobacteraceae bacterium]